MKVLVTGAKWHDNSPAIVADGFRRCGHEAEIFYDNAAHWTQTAAKFFSRTPFKEKCQYYEDRYRHHISQSFFDIVALNKPDMIFIIAGFRFRGVTIAKIRDRYRIPVVNFVVDDPAFCSRTLMRDLAAYSDVFVIDQSWMPVLEFFNPGHIHYMPHAGDILHFKRLGMPKDIDIAFGGTMALRMPNGPAGYLRASIIDALARAGFKITAFAGGITETFAEFPALRNIDYYDGYKNHDELNALYNRSRIVLSIHSPQLKSGISPRVFDAALSGTFQLVEYKPEMPALFPDGVACFKTADEAVRLARQYCMDDVGRARMERTASEIALRCHTFQRRAENVVSVINRS